MLLAWKVYRRVHLVIGLSICMYKCSSIPPLYVVQCFWTVSSYKGCLHLSDITSPWGLGCGKNVGLQDFARLWMCCHWRGIHASKTHFVGNWFNYMLWWSSCWNIILINVIIILSSVIFSAKSFVDERFCLLYTEREQINMWVHVY